MFAVVAVFGDVIFSFNKVKKPCFYFITIEHGEWHTIVHGEWHTHVLFIVGILVTCFLHMNCMLGFF
jgi:hypothetical protein